MRAGLDRHVDAARLGLAHDVERVLGRLVGDVEARAGPFGEIDRAAHRLDLADRRAGREMRQRIGAAGLLHLGLAARHDRRVLGMHDDAQPEPGDDLEGFEHGAVAGGRQVAEGVAHEALEAGDAGLGERRQLVEVVLVEQPVDAVVDMRLAFGGVLLERQGVEVGGRRMGVRHLEHGRDAAARGRRGAGAPVLLVLVARLAEMHVAVDDAGQQVAALGIDGLGRRRHQVVGADRRDHAVADRQAGGHDALGRHDGTVANDEVGLAHGRAPYIAQPPSTARSWPVTLRERSLAKNHTALATSSSVEMRRSA